MRIAVCISGQPRTWKVSYKSILNFFQLGEEVKVDYFIHAWDTNSYRDMNTPRWECADYKIDNNDEEYNINKAFNPVYMIYEKYEPEQYKTNWASMFYSFMRSVFLKMKYELENDFEYDIVVKTRFDINFPQNGMNSFNAPINKFFIHKIDPLTAYTTCSINRFPSEFFYLNFDDVFFYSDSKTMDLISNIYRWYIKIQDIGQEEARQRTFIKNVTFFYGPGTLLYKYFTEFSIHMMNYVSYRYYVVRKEAEGQGLDGIDNWQEIQNISLNWGNAQLKAIQKSIDENK
jgi:hypothetical protein